jgi:hypothetical protein
MGPKGIMQQIQGLNPGDRIELYLRLEPKNRNLMTRKMCYYDSIHNTGEFSTNPRIGVHTSCWQVDGGEPEYGGSELISSSTIARIERLVAS